ncbi:MAG: hypothetical protein IH897_08170 [Planctomycetes bacterium]|nr:hypothetical protein [Planctomycetota bacterium]
MWRGNGYSTRANADEAPAAGARNTRAEGRPRKQRGAGALGRLVVVGNVGGLELWSERSWEQQVPSKIEKLASLTTETEKILAHLSRVRSG